MEIAWEVRCVWFISIVDGLWFFVMGCKKYHLGCGLMCKFTHTRNESGTRKIKSNCARNRRNL